MKLPELPEDEKKSKRKPKFGVYRGPTADLSEGTDMNSIPSGKGEAAMSSAEAIQAQAVEGPAPELSKDIPPEPVKKTGNRLLGAFRTSGQGVPKKADKETNPGRRLHAIETAASEVPATSKPKWDRLRPDRAMTRRAYWDVAAAISLLINAILVGVVIAMASQTKNLGTTTSGVNGLTDSLMGGLYGNFVKMDQASINSTIAVDAMIPLNFVLPVSQNTQVVLTQDVTIPNAHVIIRTDTLTINSPASFTLPQGTSLPIALNLSIPVQSTIPINLQVPVHIPLNQTDLHEPFIGLQNTILPLYCTFNKNAQYPAGTYICAEHNAPTSVAP
jgi:hypothetical protein